MNLKSKNIFQTTGIPILFSLLMLFCSKGNDHSKPDDAKREQSRPNVLLISIDTLRQDHVSAYGYHRKTTPNLDRFAVEGMLFSNAISTSNWTLPAHMSMMTGLPASVHRCEDDMDRLPEELITLAQEMKKAGYKTAGFVSHVYVDSKYGFGRGFDTYVNNPDQAAEMVSNQAISWLEEAVDGPFFLFVHYFDPHWGYNPKAPFDTMFGNVDKKLGTTTELLKYVSPNLKLPPERLEAIQSLYDGEIAYTDSQIERIFDWLGKKGWVENTVALVFSDHGEEFEDHGDFGHGGKLHSEVTLVPFMMRVPGNPSLKGRSDRLVSLVDIPRTVLSATGNRAVPQFTKWGIDLTSKKHSERNLVIESTRWGPKRFAVQTSEYKLMTPGSYTPIVFGLENNQLAADIMNPGGNDNSLYNVQSDPKENENLIGDKTLDPIRADLTKQLKSYINGNVRGLRLECSCEDIGDQLLGEIEFEQSLWDDPLVLYPAEHARATVLSEHKCQFLTVPKKERATLLFPLTGKPGEVTVALYHGDKPVMKETVQAPHMGEEKEIKTKECSCNLFVPAYEVQSKGATTNLTKEEEERLRALGYIE